MNMKTNLRLLLASFNDAANTTMANGLSLNANQPYLLTVTGTTKTLSSGVTAIAASVPEPQTYAMLLAGLGLVGAVARRRRGTAAV